MSHTPASILSTLLPTLIQSARYAKLVQHKIHALEDKDGTDNIFAAALSDADLSVQTHVELALLANFPKIPFFGEEWKSSRNTKYLSGTWFQDNEPYLITLDPIDGTRIYLDGGKCFQIILNVVSRSGFEASLILYPVYNQYIYALKSGGAFSADFETPFNQAKPHKIGSPPSAVYISGEFLDLAPKLSGRFKEVVCAKNYSKDDNKPYPGEILRNGLCGMMQHESQVIDGAALSFVAQEMGFLVQTPEGGPIPPIEDHRDLNLPGLIVGDSKDTINALLAFRR